MTGRWVVQIQPALDARNSLPEFAELVTMICVHLVQNSHIVAKTRKLTVDAVQTPFDAIKALVHSIQRSTKVSQMVQYQFIRVINHKITIK